MKSQRVLVGVLTALFLLGGCMGGPPASPQTSSPSTASICTQKTLYGLTLVQLGELGARIQKNPDRADTILQEAGLPRDQFERAIRTVSSNTQWSRCYRQAFEDAL